MGKYTKRKKMIVSEGSARYYPSDALSLDELQYWIAFSRVLGIGPVRFKLLLDFFQEDVAAAWQADHKTLVAAGIDLRIAEKFISQRSSINPEHELTRLERLHIRVITWKDATYLSTGFFSFLIVELKKEVSPVEHNHCNLM